MEVTLQSGKHTMDPLMPILVDDDAREEDDAAKSTTLSKDGDK